MPGQAFSASLIPRAGLLSDVGCPGPLGVGSSVLGPHHVLGPPHATRTTTEPAPNVVRWAMWEHRLPWLRTAVRDSLEGLPVSQHPGNLKGLVLSNNSQAPLCECMCIFLKLYLYPQSPLVAESLD